MTFRLDPARVTGLLLVAMAGTAMYAELGVRAALVVPGDAAATAARLLAAPGLAGLGLVAYGVTFLLDVPVAVLFYRLTREPQPTVAQVAAALRLVYAAVAMACLLPFAGALAALGGSPALAAFSPAQRQGLASLGLGLFEQGFHLALGVFGLHLALLGLLLLRARRVPAWLGALVGLGGLAYGLNALTSVLAPGLNAAIAPVLGMFGMAELVLALWLVAGGYRGSAS